MRGRTRTLSCQFEQCSEDTSLLKSSLAHFELYSICSQCWNEEIVERVEEDRRDVDLKGQKLTRSRKCVG